MKLLYIFSLLLVLPLMAPSEVAAQEVNSYELQEAARQTVRGKAGGKNTRKLRARKLRARKLQARKGRSRKKQAVRRKTNKKHRGVLGKDDRIGPLTEHLTLLDSVGVLFNNQAHSACTAFCISPDTIVSAAHCLFSAKLARKLKANQIDLSKTWFKLPGRYASSALSGSGNEEISDGIVAGLKNLPKSISRFNKDWMILKLRRSICRNSLPLAVLPMKDLRQAAREKKLLLAGFHGDMWKRNMLISPACGLGNWRDPKILTRKWRRSRGRNSLLLHKCDAYKGSSGSPMLIKVPGGYKVVAVNVGNITKYEDLRRGKRLIRRKLTGNINVAVLAEAFAADAKLMISTRLVVKREQIRHMQSLLGKAGFNPGPLDGVLGGRTRKAIRGFQRQHKLAETGRASFDIYRKLAPIYDRQRILAHEKRYVPLQPFSRVNCLTPGNGWALLSKQACSRLGGKAGPRLADKGAYVDCLLPGRTVTVTIRSKMCKQSKGVVVENVKIPRQTAKMPPAARKAPYQGPDVYVDCRLPGSTSLVSLRAAMCHHMDGTPMKFVQVVRVTTPPPIRKVPYQGPDVYVNCYLPGNTSALSLRAVVCHHMGGRAEKGAKDREPLNMSGYVSCRLPGEKKPVTMRFNMCREMGGVIPGAPAATLARPDFVEKVTCVFPRGGGNGTPKQVMTRGDCLGRGGVTFNLKARLATKPEKGGEDREPRKMSGYVSCRLPGNTSALILRAVMCGHMKGMWGKSAQAVRLAKPLVSAAGKDSAQAGDDDVHCLLVGDPKPVILDRIMCLQSQGAIHKAVQPMQPKFPLSDSGQVFCRLPVNNYGRRVVLTYPRATCLVYKGQIISAEKAVSFGFHRLQ